MIGDNNKAIYLQIADSICEEILRGNLKPGDRILSVREYAASAEVNANTVMRAYDFLAGQEILFNKRGIGYFVSEDVENKVHKYFADPFYEKVLPALFERMALLDVRPETFDELYRSFLENFSKK